MTPESFWQFVTNQVPIKLGPFTLTWLHVAIVLATSLVVVLYTTRQTVRSLTLSGDGGDDRGNKDGKGPWLLLFFFLFVVGFLGVVWVATHFLDCKQPQCTIIVLAAIVILFGIFIAVAAPFSNNLGDLSINIGKDKQICAKGLAISSIVAGFAVLLVVGYWIPC